MILMYCIHGAVLLVCCYFNFRKILYFPYHSHRLFRVFDGTKSLRVKVPTCCYPSKVTLFSLKNPIVRHAWEIHNVIVYN